MSFPLDLSIRLDQSNVKLSIPAGSSYTGTVKVYNQANHPVAVKIYLQDWEYTDKQDGSKDFFPAGSTSFSCAPWISFSPSELIIPAYGVKQVNYTINIPSQAIGAYYCVMFFETDMGKSAEAKELAPEEMQSSIALKVRLGLLFFVESKDTAKRRAEITNFSVEKSHKDKYLLIQADLKNTGNTYIIAYGTYHIMDNKGIVYARGEFNKVYTFAGDTAKLIATWKEGLPKGKYSAVLTVDIGKGQEEAGLDRGPVIVKEAQIEIGEEGEILKVGELK